MAGARQISVVLGAVKQWLGASTFFQGAPGRLGGRAGGGRTTQDLKGDMELVLEAIKQDGRSRQSASKELRRDRDVVMQTINQTWLGACVSFRGTELRQGGRDGGRSRRRGALLPMPPRT